MRQKKLRDKNNINYNRFYCCEPHENKIYLVGLLVSLTKIDKNNNDQALT